MIRFALLCFAAALAGAAEPIAFPAWAGVHDVTVEFGAKGDGTTDDTEAINRALGKYHDRHMEIVYLPAGTYLVSSNLNFACWLYLQGAGVGKTIIKLKDRCPGFQTPGDSKAVIGWPRDEWGGSYNMAFSRHINDLSVDTGTGNPGAIGIRHISNNGGGIENVEIRSGDGKGDIGLDLRQQWDGPCVYRNVSISGFTSGIVVHSATYASTMENITIDKVQVGLRNECHPIALRKFDIRTSGGPAIENAIDNGHLVLLDSVLRGKGEAAISNAGRCLLRNVAVEGFAAPLAGNAELKGKKVITEYLSGPVRTQREGGATGTLNLPIKEHPPRPWDKPADWANVMDYGPIRLDERTRKPTDRTWEHEIDGFDITDALQKAIDSGKPTVALPHGGYLVRRSIHLRGRMRVLQGNGSMIYADQQTLAGKPMFIFDGKEGPMLHIERLSFTQTYAEGPQVMHLEHASPRTLVVQSSRWLRFSNAQGAGELFIDDLCGAPLLFKHPQQVWIRGLNMESGDLMLTNTAATLWILGLKTEGSGVVMELGKDSATEILGGLMYPAGGDYAKPAFRSQGGRFFASQCLFGPKQEYMEEQVGGKTKLYKLKDGEDRFIDFASHPAKR
jgi:hypothetical protein